MMAKKQSAPVIIACFVMATGTAALANNLGTPGSALDPNNYVAPPQTRIAKPPSLSGAPAGEAQEEIQSTTTFVTMPGFGEPTAKPGQKAEKAPKTAKVKTKNSDDGLLSGVNDKFKSAGSGLASGTKAAGDQMKKGTKVVGEGIASSAKASSSFFMKGARAIGSGTKKVGSKVAQSTKAAGDTMKDGTHVVADHMPFIGKSGKSAEEKPVVAKQDDLKPAGGDKSIVDEKVAAANDATFKDVTAKEPVAKDLAPKVAAKQETKTASAKPGIVGKTLGTFSKLNVFHKKGGDGLETAGKTPSSADLTH